MKIFIALLLFLLTGIPGVTAGQSYRQTVEFSESFTDIRDVNNRFHLMNIHGPVTVETYDGEHIELVIDETIEGTDREIEQGRQELEFILERKGTVITGYLTAPFIEIRRRGDRISYRMDRRNEDYRFTHTITARVPAGIIVDVSTINRGGLHVSGSFRELNASNVNGEITLDNIRSPVNTVSTVNGNISITYAAAPTGDSKYSTINGTIDLRLPQHTSADIYFKSMHGDLYTDFDNIKRLSPEVQKEEQSSGKKTAYRVNRFNPVRIGDGGPQMKFEVLNGDVYLRKQ